jgi:hypothetical protein
MLHLKPGQNRGGSDRASTNLTARRPHADCVCQPLAQLNITAPGDQDLAWASTRSLLQLGKLKNLVTQFRDRPYLKAGM